MAEDSKSIVKSKGGVDPARWLDNHGDALFAYARLVVRSSSVAEDLVQETFLAALRTKDGFESASSERTWLIAILRHKIVDYFRKNWRENRAIQEAGEPTGTAFFAESGAWKRSPAEWTVVGQKSLESGEFFKALGLCLEKLPQKMGDAFCLREIERLSSDEVCQVLGITPTNLWTLLHRARLALRECLEQSRFTPDSR